jgi:hypothetical protein
MRDAKTATCGHADMMALNGKRSQSEALPLPKAVVLRNLRLRTGSQRTAEVVTPLFLA